MLNSPIILGHESSGTVVECGDKVKNVKVGQRVAIEVSDGAWTPWSTRTQADFQKSPACLAEDAVIAEMENTTFAPTPSSQLLVLPQRSESRNRESLT